MKYLLPFILLISIGANAQLQRYDTFAATTASASGIGNLAQVIPNATLQVFNYPGAGVNCALGGCVAATTYTSRTGLTACGGGLPLTRPTANVCLSTADASGNFGFWAPAGNYQYCVVATFSTQCYNIILGVATDGCSFTNWLFNNTNCFAGADIGSQFNAAYGAMPGNGTRFHVPPSSSAYSFTTPMVATTVANSVMLSCPVEQSSKLTFTPTTGSALTLTGGGGNHNEGGVQVENCTFYGTGNGNANVGLQLGSGSNGLSGATLKNITIGSNTGNSFGTGLLFNSNGNSYLLHSFNSHVIGNATGATIYGEGINFYGGIFGSNTTGISMPGSFGAQVHFHGTSFDDNGTAASLGIAGAIWNCAACHFENAGGGVDSYISQTAGNSILSGGEFSDDCISLGNPAGCSAGPVSGFVTASAGSIYALGTTIASGNRVNTQAFNLSGNVNAVLFPIQLTSAASIPNIVTPAYITPAGGHGAVMMAPLQTTSNTINFLLSGTGFDGASIGPGLDLIGQEAGGKCFRFRENGGFLEWVDCATRNNPGMRGRLVGVNFNVETEGVYATTAAGSTACTNGELALSAGWQSTGSATVTAVQGTGQTCSWTITTGTTTAANPTVTDTLVDPLPAATIVCEMNIHGGTHTAAAGEAFQQTTLSSTAPVFTFTGSGGTGTPQGGGVTYLVTRRCGP